MSPIVRVPSWPAMSAMCSRGTPAADKSETALWRSSVGVQCPGPAPTHLQFGRGSSVVTVKAMGLCLLGNFTPRPSALVVSYPAITSSGLRRLALPAAPQAVVAWVPYRDWRASRFNWDLPVR
jgi:hypothetical protein